MKPQSTTSLIDVLLEKSNILRGVIRRLVTHQDDRADVYQETLTALIERGQRDDICDPLAYAVTVARHLAYNRPNKITSCLDDEPEMLDEQTVEPEQHYLAQEQVARVQEALAMLPSLRREVFIRRRLHQQSREQIAKELGLTEEAVKKHVTRALAQLAMLLEE